VYLNKPYTCLADMWSAGILILETILGKFLPADNENEMLPILHSYWKRFSVKRPLPVLLLRLLEPNCKARVCAADAVRIMRDAHAELLGAKDGNKRGVCARTEPPPPCKPLPYFERWRTGSLLRELAAEAPANGSKAGLVSACRPAAPAGVLADVEAQVDACFAHCEFMSANNPLTARRDARAPHERAAAALRSVQLEALGGAGLQWASHGHAQLAAARASRV
jgi:hypothetical protein